MSFLSMTPPHSAVAWYLDHVLLDTGRVAAPQDAEQLVIRDEEEARESITLRIQIVIETLLALLQAVAQAL